MDHFLSYYGQITVAYNIDIFDIQAEALPQDCLSTATNIER
jgi:hypothetical protein